LAGIARSPFKQLMKIGILSKVFTRPTMEDVFDVIAAAGLKCFQFNAEIAGLPPVPDEIPAGLAARVRQAAATRGLEIASVQATFNMSHPDPEFRRRGLRRLRRIAEACGALGTSVIAICIGTRDRENMWRHHPDNDTTEAWGDMTSCVREAVRMAEDAGVTLALEPEVTNVVDSPRKARRLLDEIGSPSLKITMDAANLFHAGELPRMAEVLDEAFALLGSDIILAHAKDLSHDGEAGHEAAGQGLLDYDRYISLLRRSGFSGPLLLHGLPEEQVGECVAFLKRKLAAANPN
jgi:sugar phosphate isomerase/epimerase